MFHKMLIEQKKYLKAKKWKKALEINNKLIELEPDNASLYKDRSLFFRRIKDLDSAKEAMVRFLSIKCGKNFEKVLSNLNYEIKKELALPHLYSSYKITESGGFNYGTIVHATNDGRFFFTKISQINVGDKEAYFYREIRERHEELKGITLDLCHEYKDKRGKISFLTFPKINGPHASLGRNKELVFAAYKKITSIGAHDLSEYFVNDVGAVVSSRQELKLSLIFSKLDDIKVLEQVFKWAAKRIEKFNSKDNSTVESDFIWLEKEVIDKRLFDRNKGKLMFTMMHGDFHQGNLLLNEDGALYLIDWPNVGVAPKGVDMTKLFRREKWDFNTIRSEFIEKSSANNNMSAIEKCAVSFTMILTWLNFMPKTALKNYDNYIGGALEYIRSVAELE